MYELLSVLRDVEITWGDDGATDDSTGTSDKILTDMINVLLERYKSLVVGVLGLATLTMILIGLYLFLNVGAGSTNFAQKNTNMKRMTIWAICMALLGSVDLIACLVYNVFR